MTIYATNKEYSVSIPSASANLPGFLYIPDDAQGIILFAHGSGSSRHSSRNQLVARVLNEAKLATLLFDLLTPAEEAVDSRTAEFRFNIPFLASRLMDATQWCVNQLTDYPFKIGYFGASTGGGAALVAAAKSTTAISAVVSRGGRPDLAKEALPLVKAPTLLIVGGHDDIVITMNKAAMEQMHCYVELEIIPGATHLFEEPGALNEVARLATDWFLNYLN